MIKPCTLDLSQTPYLTGLQYDDKDWYWSVLLPIQVFAVIGALTVRILLAPYCNIPEQLATLEFINAVSFPERRRD